MPSSNRISGQYYLFQAYGMYARNDFPGALRYLDKAIQEDTYLIDYYLMRSLVLKRMGDFEGALEEIEHYLEVRPRDFVPEKIKKNIMDLQAFSEEALRGILPRETFSVESVSLKKILGVTPLIADNMAGMGKISVIGDYAFLPDTLGDRLYVIDMKKRFQSKSFLTKSPIRVLSFSGKDILLCDQEGDLRSIHMETGEETLKGSLPEVFLKDGLLLSDSRFIYADWKGRRIACVTYPELEHLWEWRPEQNPSHFAPSGLDSCGNLVALADEEGQRIFVLDGLDGTTLEIHDCESPLHLGWTSWGSLCVLDEKGDVWLQSPSGEFETFATLPGAWSFARRGMGLMFLHVSGKTLWTASMMLPDHFLLSLFWLQFPQYAQAPGNSRVAQFEGGVCYPVQHLFQKDVTTSLGSYVTGVWMGNGLEGSIEGVVNQKRYVLLVGKDHFPAWSGKSLQVVKGAFFEGLDRVCQNEKGIPGKILLDSAIELTFDEYRRLLGYALFNGISVSTVHSSTPLSPFLARLVRLSGGEEGVFLEQEPDSWETPFYKFSFSLPKDIYPSGYPSKSLFSLSLESGYYSFLDWIPFWPAGLESFAVKAVPHK